ncbi:MAG TPA: DUF6370 family protein [Verrucomicrobiae bacterium]|nr:DUF6370 family protein [Verrucomicrobiae bacterium]
MKKSKWFLTLAAGLLAATFTVRALAADTNEVKLSGMMVCAKCKLHLARECRNVLQVTKDGKTVDYFLMQNKVSKDFHHNICTTDGEKVTVIGTLPNRTTGNAITTGNNMLIASKIEAVK